MENKYIIYARVSSEKQRNNTSIETQIEKCINYVLSMPCAAGETHRLFPNPTGDGITPYIFSDVESASDPDNEIFEYIVDGTIDLFFKKNRPQLWAAMQACRKYGCNLIVAYVDRLSRQVTIENILTHIFLEFGRTIICADAGSPLERSIKSFLAQEDNRQRRLKIIDGVNKAKTCVRETGFYPNGSPVKFFDKNGHPRYGGPAPKTNKASLAGVAARRENAKRTPKYKATEYLLQLFSEQDFLRLQRRLKNLEKCREYHLSMAKLREMGYAAEYDTPLAITDMVYMANVYVPEQAAWLETKNKRPYTSQELYAIIRRHTEAAEKYVRVKIWEGLYNGQNLKDCLIVSKYGESNRKGDGNKRVINAFCIRRTDYDAIVEMGEAAFQRIIATHDKSELHTRAHTYLPLAAQKPILTGEIVDSALTR